MAPKKIKGFTLLELMIATAIIIVALSGLLAVFARLLYLNENAKNLTMAITAAQDKMEEIRNYAFDSIYADYNGAAFDPANFPPSESKGNVYVDNTNPNLLKICVSVSWRERSNRIIGEDTNLNGALDSGEDKNVDDRLSSPAEVVSLIGRR